SSQENDNQWPDTTSLYANTDRKTKKLKQKYDEHLVGVTKNALRTAHLLPAFEKEPPVAQDIRALKQLSPKEFRWQDKAVKQISEWKGENKEDAGFFVVNMASTGCGKTFANAKIMQALSNDKNSLRYILALGLRTLTLQTGDEYRGRIGLDNTELAVLIGSKAVQELHDQRTETDECSEFESEGSESEELLLDESVDFDCAIPEEGLATVLTREKDRKFLYAPVLACTIDHIMGATETKRGGKYILPFLRLMSSHLVIDEVDDFTGSDLIAIGRLIHLAGMLGRKVMISSATIPPDLAEGYFNAYRAGRQIFSAARDRSCKIGCAWVDEFTTQVVSVEQVNQKSVNKYYREKHADFITIRVKQLQKQSAKRKANICYCSDIVELSEANSEEIIKEQYFNKFKHAIIEKHNLHSTVDKITGKNISFGVVRVANIKPCIKLTKYLLESEFPHNIEIRTMAYHSQQVLLLRHEQEKHLDLVLKRKEDTNQQPQAFENNVIRKHIDNCGAENLIFILVATPVEEVGRDHDFDWAVVEPSSYRSIVQLAGRVRRHRKESVQKPNISLLQYNWKAIRSRDKSNKPCFIKPGYEGSSKETRLNTHDLSQLLDVGKIESCVDAIPRVQKSNSSDHRISLADLEHYVTHTLLTNYEINGPDSMQGYLDETWHLTAMPQQMHPFRNGEPSLNLYLYFEPEKEKLIFAEKDESGQLIDRGNIYSVKSINLENKNLDRLWLNKNYLKILGIYSQQQELSNTEISRRYGELSFIYREGNEYEYSDQFGLVEV
ncbi:MAG: type I-F CRISPR-associated helicase Cas3, partial [Gammaproteobacteria bacterium]